MTAAKPELALVPAAPLNVFQALQSVMREVKAIGKTSVNRDQGYSFRGIDAVMSTLHPILAEHGIVFTPKVEERIPEMRKTNAGKDMNVVHLRVRYRFFGPDGSHIDATTWGEGADMADKATNKAMTAALKYALVQVFCIATADMEDGDATTEEASKASDPAALEEIDAIVDGCTTVPEYKHAYLAITTANREGRITMDDRAPRQEAILAKIRELENIPPDVRLAGELPLNQDGSVSRSRITEEEKAANGLMTKEQQAEHAKLANLKDPKKATRSSPTAPVEDEWTTPAEPSPDSVKFCEKWLIDLEMCVTPETVESALVAARREHENDRINTKQLGTLVAAASARARELSEA